MALVKIFKALRDDRCGFAVQRPAAHAQFFGRQSAASASVFQGAIMSCLLGFARPSGLRREQRFRPIGRTGALRNPRRQIARGDFLVAAQDDRMLDSGAQLADVARPGVAQQQVHRLGRKGRDRLARSRANSPRKFCASNALCARWQGAAKFP